MALKKFLMVAVVAALLVACGDGSGSNSVTDPEEDSSSVCEDCDGSSSSKAKSSSSATSNGSSLAERKPCDVKTDENCFKDERDGQTYRTVKIGDQVWMAENLNYASYTDVPYKYYPFSSDSISWCYDNDPANCAKYGRLYTWAAAMDSLHTTGCGYRKKCSPTYPVRGLCPEGWHLPKEMELKMLRTAVGGQYRAGKMLKSINGWNWNEHDDLNGNGTDDYSFAALPAGYRNYDGLFSNEGYLASFWSSDEVNSDDACNMYMYHYNDEAYVKIGFKYDGMSVRCVKD